MTMQIAKDPISNEFEMIEQVVMRGDLSSLNPSQRVTYYNRVCESLGLNPYTRPFDYITLNGKLTLYAKKDATEQLRKRNGISITSLDGKVIDDLYIVTATAKTNDGRVDQATGAVSLGALKGDAKANAIMKAETKAKRRVTLSIAGLGWTDETELDAIPGARPTTVDMETGEIIDKVKPLYIEDQPKFISKEQARELKDLHSKANPDTREAVLKTLVEKKIAGWDKVPANLYAEIKTELSTKKTVVEEPHSMDELVGVIEDENID